MRKRSGKDEKVVSIRKAPKDTNQLARSVMEQIERIADAPEAKGKNPAAVMLGRKGGLKGGHARAAKMTPEERRASALKAAKARWAKRG